MPVTDTTFEGLANEDNQDLVGEKVLPPDANGDVGPNHYLQTTNVSFAVFDKAGVKDAAFPVPNNAMWAIFDINKAARACRDRNDGDPIVLYDHLGDRWLFSQFALAENNQYGGPFYQCIAVSQTGDPTGSWHRYAYRWSKTKLNDYPKFGVWPGGYYMSVNQFDLTRFNPFAGVGVAVFERGKMLRGEPARMVKFDLEDDHPNLFSLLPADLDGLRPPKGAPNPFVGLGYNSSGATTNRLLVWEFAVNWSRPQSSTFKRKKALSTASFDSVLCGARGCVPQPDTDRKLDPISDRLMYRLQYRNFGTHMTMVVNHTVDADGSGRAGIRWYELRDHSSGWRIRQQGTYAPDDGLADHHRWMGSIAMDRAGNMAVGYSISSDSIYPSINYTGRLARDPRDELSQGEAQLHAGEGSQTHSAGRWGDYTMMAVDPTDGCEFWYTNEYYAATSELNWRTRVGSFEFEGDCPDETSPTAPELQEPAGPWQTVRSAPVSWTESTDDGSGVAGYSVERRVAHHRRPWGAWKRWRHGLEDRTQTGHKGKPGRTYCFRARGFDNAGNISPRSARRCTALPVNDRALEHMGPWAERSGSGYYLGTFSRTKRNGAKLLLRDVRARRLSIVATTCPRCGTIKAFWNGNLLKRVKLTSPVRRQKRVIGLGMFRSVRRGTLEITVTSSGKPVIVEGAGLSRV